MTRTRRDLLAAGLAAGSIPVLNSAALFAAPATMPLSGWRSVRDFGAKGDGSTDDSTAIRAALEDLPKSGSNPVGGIFFPVGTYRVSRMPDRDCCIAPSGDHEITLMGVGSGSVLTTQDKDAAILELNGELTPQDDNIRRCVVRGLHFMGGYSGVRILYGMYNNIVECFFHSQAAWAIELIGQMHGTSLGVLSGNILTHTKGILIRGSETTGGGCGLQIIGNIIGEDISSPAAVQIERGLHYGQVSLVANTIYEPRGDAVRINDSEDTIVANNRIIRPGGCGLVAENCLGLQIIGNLFRDIGYVSGPGGLTDQDKAIGVMIEAACRDTLLIANMFRNPYGTWNKAIEDRGKRTVAASNVIAEEVQRKPGSPSKPD